jgi:DNA polymerase-3 subunit delta
MKINPQQLVAQLLQGLAPVYLVAGDEPLLVQESRDKIVQHAQTLGFTERQSFHATTDFNWDSLVAEITTQSLFSSKTLIELRINNGKPGKQGCVAIETFLSNLPRDKILLIITPKLDAAQQKTKWVKAIEKQGVFVPVWPIDNAHLPSWIKQRLQREGLSTSPEGVGVLVEQTQGNLLACDQEITKLRLLYGEKKLSSEEINDAIGDHARFDLYQLVDQALVGEAESTVRILSQLQESGTEPTLLLWSLTREIRQLIQLNALMTRGERFDSACTKLFVWKTRQPFYQSALRRLTQPQLLNALELASRIDLMIKGLQPGNVWLALNELALGIAGTTLPTAEDA